MSVVENIQTPGSKFRFDPESKKDLRGRATRNVAITIGAQGIKFGLRIVSVTVLARMLSPSDYGLVAMATAFTTILGSIREAGLSSATVQRPSITHGQVSALFWLNCLLGLAVALLCIAIAPLAVWFFHRNELLLIIPLLGGIGAIGSLGVQHTALMQRRMEFKQLMTRDLVGQVAGLLAGILAATSGFGYWSLVVMEFVSVTASTIAIWLGCNWRPSSPRGFREAIPLVKFGAHVTGGGLIHHMSRGLDVLVMGNLFGEAAVGLYGRAQHLLSTPMSQVVGPIMSVARPSLSRAAESPARLQRATFELLRIVSFACAGAVCILVPVSDVVVRIALGAQWTGAAAIFAGLAPFAIVEPCGALLCSIMVASGHPAELLKWRFFSIGIIVLGLACGLSWGPVGVAVAFGLSGLFVRMPLLMYYVSRTTGIPLYPMFESAVPNVISGLAAAAVGVVVRWACPLVNSVIEGLIVVTACGLTYILLSLVSLSGRMSLKQVQSLFSEQRKKWSAGRFSP